MDAPVTEPSASSSGATPPSPPSPSSRRALWLLAALALLSICVSAQFLVAGGGAAVVVSGRDALAHLAERPVLMVAVFSVWSLICVSLIVPVGTLSVIVGGILFGAVLPAVLWTAAQLVTAPVIYHLTRSGIGNAGSGPGTEAGAGQEAAPSAGARLVERWLGRRSAEIVDLARVDGLFTVIVLRLLPIIPSAPTCMIAAALGIQLKHLMVATLAVGWVRPLYYASLGVTIGSLSRLEDAGGVLSMAVVSQLMFVLAGGAVLWLARYLVRARTAASK
jgi:uncharacterized membrane protein YdjX (TVP38/TMEM64 family)